MRMFLWLRAALATLALGRSGPLTLDQRRGSRRGSARTAKDQHHEHDRRTLV